MIAEVRCGTIEGMTRGVSGGLYECLKAPLRKSIQDHLLCHADSLCGLHTPGDEKLSVSAHRRVRKHHPAF